MKCDAVLEFLGALRDSRKQAKQKQVCDDQRGQQLQLDKAQHNGEQQEHEQAEHDYSAFHREGKQAVEGWARMTDA